MMIPLEEANSLARFTWLAGEPSVSTSRLGMESPALTKAGREAWKLLEATFLTEDLAASPRVLVGNLKAIVTARWIETVEVS